MDCGGNVYVMDADNYRVVRFAAVAAVNSPPGLCHRSSSSSSAAPAIRRSSSSSSSTAAKGSSSLIACAFCPTSPSTSSHAVTSAPLPVSSSAASSSIRSSSSSTGGVAPTSTASLCFLSYSLPGTLDYPWSAAYSLQVTYNPTPVTTAYGQSVILLSGVGTRTYTNRFGSSISLPVTLQPSKLYLHSSPPIDSSRLTFSLQSAVQLPGTNPATTTRSLTLFNFVNQTVELGSETQDLFATAWLSNIAGFTNTTIGASNINSLAVNYATCQAPITFTNGLRAPTQPSASNGAQHFSYSYYITDGVTYSVRANLSFTTTSAFATTTDQLGNPYQTVVNITRTYTFLPTGNFLMSTVTGYNPSVSATQRFYLYSLLASSPGVYNINRVPLLDGSGIAYRIQPAAPVLGDPVDGPAALTGMQVAVQPGLSYGIIGGLQELGATWKALVRLQQQSYALL